MKIEGDQIGGLIRQSGDTMRQIDDKGTWEGKVKYICRWSNMLYLSPRRGSARHPDFSALVCSDVEVNRLKPGVVCEIFATYTGFFDQKDPEALPPYTEELIAGNSEAPIETHPRFVSHLGGTKSAPLNGAVFNDDGTFKGFKADSKFAGVEFYLVPQVTYRKSTPTRARPTSIADIGKIFNVPVAAPAGANWILTSRTWAKTGGFYTVTEEWLMSGGKGWYEEIYS